MKHCNCEFCIKCDWCGHQADEHLAGDGPCFRCGCEGHTSWIIDKWDKLDATQQATFNSFREFADQLVASKSLIPYVEGNSIIH